MSALGERWRVVVWNASGLSLPAGGVVVRHRRWKYAADGTLTFAAGTSVTVGASLANNLGNASAAITNNGASEQWLGADFIVEFPALTGTANGSIEVFVQISTDNGTTWADSPNIRRGAMIAAEFYNNVIDPPARDTQSSLG